MRGPATRHVIKAVSAREVGLSHTAGVSSQLTPRQEPATGWRNRIIKKTFEKYGQLNEVLPAMGYGDDQVKELQDTINAVPCDAVVVGTPFDLDRLIDSDKP